MAAIFEVGYFLLTLFFSLLAFVLWARIILRYFKISKLTPYSLTLDRLTDPLLRPFTPIFRKKQLSRYDEPTIFLLILIELLKFALIGLLFIPPLRSFTWIVVYTLADLIIQPANLLFYAVLIRAVMSWIPLHWSPPFHDLLVTITEPLLRIGRRIIPNISGFDFPPIVIMIILKVLTLFISASLPIRIL